MTSIRSHATPTTPLRTALATCLAALVLSACGAAPATEQTPPDAAPAPLHAMTGFQNMGGGNNPDAMYRTLVYEDGTSVATQVPYADGVQRVLCDVEGCTHSTEACPAYLFRYEVNESYGEVTYAADDTQLVRFTCVQTYQNDRLTPSRMQMTVSGPDGSNVRTIPLLQMPKYGSLIYADADCLYWLNTTYLDDTDRRLTLIATNLMTGKQRVVCTWQSTQYVMLYGSVDDALLVMEYGTPVLPDPPTVSMEEAPKVWEEYSALCENASLDAPIEVFRLRVSDGVREDTPIFSFTNREYSVYQIRDAIFYGVRNADGALIEHSFLTGEERVLASGTLPEGNSRSIQGPYADHLVVLTHDFNESGDDTNASAGVMVSVNVNTGETKPLTLRRPPERTGEPILPIAVGRERMLVVTDYLVQTRATVDENGAESSYEYWLPVIDCMSIEDYLNNVPNYTHATWLGPEFYDPDAWHTEPVKP